MSIVEQISDIERASYFRGASKHVHVQFLRYGFVALAAFAVDFGSLAVQVSLLHINYLVAAGVAFCLGLVVNYLLSTAWVFSAYQARNRWVEFGAFALTGLIGLGLTELLIWIFTDRLNLFYLVSKLITAFIVVIWNFTSRKMLLYR